MAPEALFREPVGATEERQAHVPASSKGRTATPPFPSWAKPEFVLVTPAVAQRYLDTMHANRVPSKIERGIMAENLRGGTFYPEISPVFVDGGDPLLGQDRAWDGKHRFEAVVETGVPAWMLFIRGVRQEASESIDTGRRRSYADSLKIRDVTDYRRQAVLAKYMALYSHYGLPAVRNPSSGEFPLSRRQLDEWIDKPGMHDSIKVGEALSRATTINGGHAAYAVMRTGLGQDPGGFWESVRSGEGLVTGDPALTLRNWLLRSRKRDGRISADLRLMNFYVLATAWNKYVMGQEWKKVAPSFERRANGTLYFPSSSVPDFLSADPAVRRRQLLEAREAFGYLNNVGRGILKPAFRDGPVLGTEEDRED